MNICEMISENDGLKISFAEFLPEGAPRAIMQIAHGMCEHKERYFPFMEKLAASGYAAVINDHRGHGASVKTNDDLGWFDDLALLDDMAQLTRKYKARFPGIPCMLIGHSMGSLASRVYLKKHDELLDGLILTGCPTKSSAASAGLVLIGAMTKLRGDRYVSSGISDLICGSFAKPFKSENSPFAWLNSDRNEVAKYEADPLCGFPFKLKGNASLVRLMRDTYTNGGWQLKKPDLPILFLSGGDDPCMGTEAKLKQAVGHLKTVGYGDVSYKLYPGMRHEVLFEPEHEKVERDIFSALDQISNK